MGVKKQLFLFLQFTGGDTTARVLNYYLKRKIFFEIKEWQMIY
jgi:hypothetical protein